LLEHRECRQGQIQAEQRRRQRFGGFLRFAFGFFEAVAPRYFPQCFRRWTILDIEGRPGRLICRVSRIILVRFDTCAIFFGEDLRLL
jgi:hypothetical protein